MHIPNQSDRSIGRLPVLHDGRIKPLDSVARHYLLTLQGRLKLSDETSPSVWLFSSLTTASYGLDMPLLLVENPKLFESIGPQYQKAKYRVNPTFIAENFSLIQPFVKSAQMLEKEERTPMQQSAFLLANRYATFDSIKVSFFPYYNDSQLAFWNQMLSLTQRFNQNNIETSKDFPEFLTYYDQLKQLDGPLKFIYADRWLSLPEAALQPTNQTKKLLSSYLLLSDAYRLNDNAGVYEYSSLILDDFKTSAFSQYLIVNLEFIFNAINPFIASLFIYIVILLFVFITRFFNIHHGKQWIQDAWLIALLFHTFGLIARIVILARPPVINLYSSAIFIAYIASLIGYFMYKRRHVLFYAGTTSVIGALSLIVAYHLSLTGDTLTVMQAVLNSNFWLATHVVAMTIGYAIIFIAGFFAITYILMGTLTKLLTKELDDQISKIVYVFLMISLFFNFVGTVLGGIWADQSWGRFWGWDPKENGAILIVLWTAIILHMKWGRLLTNQRLMILATGSNIVTAWSWKGTNMLGIGLHSYGFTEATFYWLMMFFVSQIAIMLLGALPKKYWLSNQITNR